MKAFAVEFANQFVWYFCWGIALIVLFMFSYYAGGA